MSHIYALNGIALALISQQADHTLLVIKLELLTTYLELEPKIKH
jgi:hypothetical protein